MFNLSKLSKNGKILTIDILPNTNITDAIESAFELSTMTGAYINFRFNNKLYQVMYKEPEKYIIVE